MENISPETCLSNPPQSSGVCQHSLIRPCVCSHVRTVSLCLLSSPATKKLIIQWPWSCFCRSLSHRAPWTADNRYAHFFVLFFVFYVSWLPDQMNPVRDKYPPCHTQLFSVFSAWLPANSLLLVALWLGSCCRSKSGVCLHSTFKSVLAGVNQRINQPTFLYNIKL